MSILSRIAQKLDFKLENEHQDSNQALEKPEGEKNPEEKKEIDTPASSVPSQNQDFIEAETMKTIVSLIKDGVILLDSSNKVILTNKAAQTITKLSLDEMSGKNLDKLISAKDEGGNNFSLDAFCKRPTSNPTISLSIKDNEHPIKIELSASTTKDKPTGAECILILHDISKEKMFEQMQIDFVSMASHEFRTPLTSIINYLSVLQEESGSKLDAEQKSFLDRALSSSQELSALVDNILNVSKIERGSSNVSLKPLDWQKNLTQLVGDNQTMASQKNISLTLKLPDKPIPEVLADSLRINEVLNNLISNATTYTPKGGKIEVGVKIETEEVTTYVADNGVGITKEVIPHLFTKFFRGPGALEQNNKGNGLGLYISKSIIDLHHGKMWVESKEGKGSTFYFSLPRADQTQVTPTIANLHP